MSAGDIIQTIVHVNIPFTCNKNITICNQNIPPYKLFIHIRERGRWKGGEREGERETEREMERQRETEIVGRDRDMTNYQNNPYLHLNYIHLTRQCSYTTNILSSISHWYN